MLRTFSSFSNTDPNPMTSGNYPEYYIMNLFMIIFIMHTYSLMHFLVELDGFDSEN